MKMKAVLAVWFLSLLGFSGLSRADLEPWEDYDISDAVWSVTTIKVAPNMQDAYLEGLAKTWVESNNVFKKLGQIEDFWIYRSDLPQSGDFNLMLVVKFANTADLAPNKARYDAYMKEVSRKVADENTEYSQKNYPAMREITGEYQLREITLK
jgi:hypothetical protein